MPIITPAYPSMCSTFNITHSSKTIIQKELEDFAQVVDQIMVGKLPWKSLFVKHTFFTQDYKYYIMVNAASTTKENSKIWGGFVESKIRLLVQGLERHSSIRLARPFNKGYERRHKVENDEQFFDVQNGSFKYKVEDDDDSEHEQKDQQGNDAQVDAEAKVKPEIKAEDGQDVNPGDVPTPSGSKVYTTTHYIGLELAEGRSMPGPMQSSPEHVWAVSNFNTMTLGAKSLDLSYQVNNFKAMCSEWEKFDANLNFLTVQHVKK